MSEEIIKHLKLDRKEESITDVVIEAIRKALEKGELKPGDQLPSETELAEVMSISRGSVREAMKILSAYGVVNIQRGKGTFISENTDSKGFVNPMLFNFLLLKPNQEEIVDYRYFIERSVFEMAIKNATANDIELLENNLKDMKKLFEENFDSADNSSIELEIEFHRLLGKSTKNRLLEKTYQIAMEYFFPKVERTHYNKARLEETIEIHEKSINTIKERSYENIEKVLNMNTEIWIRLSKKSFKNKSSLFS